MELITVKVFDSGIEAHILKERLESEYIPCFILDAKHCNAESTIQFCCWWNQIKGELSQRSAAEPIFCPLHTLREPKEYAL
jgi:hypothetical protein